MSKPSWQADYQRQVFGDEVRRARNAGRDREASLAAMLSMVHPLDREAVSALYAELWPVSDEDVGDRAALIVKRLTTAMREADIAFEQSGGGTRHHVRDCLLPVLAKHGLAIVIIDALKAARAGG